MLGTTGDPMSPHSSHLTLLIATFHAPRGTTTWNTWAVGSTLAARGQPRLQEGWLGRTFGEPACRVGVQVRVRGVTLRALRCPHRWPAASSHSLSLCHTVALPTPWTLPFTSSPRKSFPPAAQPTGLGLLRYGGDSGELRALSIQAHKALVPGPNPVIYLLAV